MSRPLAVVTGASQGIGRAVALGLAHAGFDLVVTGRVPARLEALAAALPPAAAVHRLQADLAEPRQVEALADGVLAAGDPALLVHGAGFYARGPWAEEDDATLRRLMAVNVEAPARLNRRLLPALARRQGQIVFIVSSQVLAPVREVGAYAASKLALKALADTLRQEVNERGIRVISLHPGSTASPTQEWLHGQLGRPYHPELLMQPEDVAEMLVAAVRLPRTAEVTDIHMRPMRKPA
jgi:short-subunit dehydrogenase